MFSIDNGQSFEEINNNISFTFEELYRDCDDYIYGTTNKRLVRSMVSTVTSVNTISQVHSLSIIINPNPVGETISVYIESVKNLSSTALVGIYNPTGQLVEEYNLSLNNNCLTLNISHLKNGLYILNLRIHDQIHTQKFLKL